MRNLCNQNNYISEEDTSAVIYKQKIMMYLYPIGAQEQCTFTFSTKKNVYL
jgi:hypothetical protein